MALIKKDKPWTLLWVAPITLAINIVILILAVILDLIVINNSEPVEKGFPFPVFYMLTFAGLILVDGVVFIITLLLLIFRLLTQKRNKA